MDKADKASVNNLVAIIERKADQSVLMNYIDAERANRLTVEQSLTLMSGDVRSMRSEVNANTSKRGENMDVEKRLNELSAQVTILKGQGEAVDWAKLVVEWPRIAKAINELSVQMALKADRGKMDGIEQTIGDLKEELCSQGLITFSARVEQSKGWSPNVSQTIDAANISTNATEVRRNGSNIGSWFCRLVELLICATDARSTGAYRVGGGFQYKDDISLFDKTTHQAMVDLLASCSTGHEITNLASTQPLALNRPTSPRVHSLERKLAEISGIIALKADQIEVTRLAAQLQALSDGGLSQAIRTQRVVTRPTSARKGGRPLPFEHNPGW